MSKPKTARSVALDALLQMEQNEGYSNLVIDQALKASGLDRRDSALASALFYGVLERRLTLDWLISRCLREPGKRLDKAVRMALRCGAYQIFYLDRVPDSAAVNETVNAVKARGKGMYAGFVNGVLRGLIRQKGSLSLPQGNSAEALSLRCSVPEGLIELWRDAYGEEVLLRLLASLEEKPELYLRVNTLRAQPEALAASLEGEGAALELLAFPQGSGKLTGCGSPASLSEFQQGLFHIQDLSAQLVCEILDPQPGETVLDCCAAPGGKTFTAAEKMGDRGAVIALDLYPGRVGLIREGARRLGLSCVTAAQADMASPAETGVLPAGCLREGQTVDRVLCDVPCSGFGVIRRKPEIRYKDLAEAERLPELQYAILQNASRLLKPGGVLVYSTCTLNPRENARVADRFLEENNGFSPRAIDLPGFRRVVEEPPHQLTMMPFAGASDGFFAASFVKK